MKKIYVYKGDLDYERISEEIKKNHFLEIVPCDNVPKLLKCKNEYIFLPKNLVDDIVYQNLINNNTVISSLTELDDIPFQRAAIEISGCCNAMCKYCPTGINYKKEKSYFQFDDFKRNVEYLIENKIIDSGTVFDLYSWGEPLLNPEFDKITTFLADINIEYTLSTNGSMVPKGEAYNLSKLSQLVISMPGFSTFSYQNMYGFSFKKIISNIESIIKLFRKCGFEGNILFLYHIYQYNISEIKEAKQFARKFDADFYPCFAFPISLDLCIDYLTKNIDYKKLYRMSKELIMFHIDSIISKRPANYYCGQSKLLTIDEHGYLVLGCCTDKYSKYAGSEYKHKLVTTMKKSEIRKYKTNIFSSYVCEICRNCNADFCGSNCGNYTNEFIKGIKI